ncbi:MAG: hypothetical protein BHW52_02950 [Ruminococcus sp. 37_24]|nr:MAG: hypothetical protein BHW52_02950 [Ruminococcus sp. 37_24]
MSEMEVKKLNEFDEDKNIFLATNRSMVDLAAKEAKEIIDAIVNSGIDRRIFQVVWNTVLHYADKYNEEYINYMSKMSNNVLNILYKTMVIEYWYGKEYCPCVYIVKNNLTNKYKIGYSTQPLTRLKNLQHQLHSTNSKATLDLIGCIYSPKNALKLEKYYHQKYSKVRELGEWFNLSNENINEIFDSGILKNMKIKIKYHDEVYNDNGFKTIQFENVPRKVLLRHTINRMIDQRLIRNIFKSESEIDVLKKVCELMKDYTGNNIQIFDKHAPESFNLYEYLVNNDLLDVALNSDIGFIEEYEYTKKKLLYKYFSEYIER